MGSLSKSELNNSLQGGSIDNFETLGKTTGKRGTNFCCSSAAAVVGDDELEHSPRELQKFLAWTLIICRNVRDRPIFTVEAQVYHLDRNGCGGGETGQWIEMSPQPVCVHVYNDIMRESYRILSVDGSKPLINLALTPVLDVKRSGAKFVHWSDTNSSIMYGLGFQNAEDANLFKTKIKELKATLSTAKTGAARIDQSSIEDPVLNERENVSSNPSPIPMAASAESVIISSGTISPVKVLRSQTERLKAVVADSSMTAKSWDQHFQRLTEQNEQLKSALVALTSLHETSQANATNNGQVDYAGNSIPPREFSLDSPYTELGQSSIVQNKSIPRQFPNSNKSESENGGGDGNRQVLLQLHKAIGEKLNEAITLHKAMMNFL